MLTSIGLIRTALLVGLCLACATGCKKQLPVATMPPPAAQTRPRVHHTEKLPEPPTPQTSPPGPIAQSTITSRPMATIPPPPPPVPPKPKKRVARKTPRTTSTPVAPEPSPVETARGEPAGPAPSASAETPRLEQLLSPEQEQSFNQSIDQELQRARNNLALAQTKNLSEPQKTAVSQVQSFIKQAEDVRKMDLVEAKGLSHKADILASDLARSFQ